MNIATATPLVGNLIGQSLPDGWVIDRQLPRAGTPGATDMSGSFFSLSYIAKKKESIKGKETETEAFVKVIDVMNALRVQQGSTLMERLSLVTASYGFECSILDMCEKARLDRVVQIIAKGELPPPPGSGVPIPYMLFELADGDVRKIVSKTNKLDDAWRFRVLHDVAVGLQQLHGLTIAHQDLKPSNVLIFDKAGQGAKIGDLGRASHRSIGAGHDGFTIAGATIYAPPEQVFGICPERWEDRREGCDLYHLGTLTTFLFSGCTPTDYFMKLLPPELRPFAWGGNATCDYQTALPMLSSTFTAFVDDVSNDLPEWARDEVSQIILNACNPDYLKRGDPVARQQTGKPLGIPSFVSRFARLSKRAEVEMRR
jgi:serine/threonine protein kinase